MAKATAKTFELADALDQEPTKLMTDFVEWLGDKVGYEELDETSVYLAWRLRLVFQASPENQSKLAARKAEIAAEKSAPKEKAAPKAKAGKAAVSDDETPAATVAPSARRRPAAAKAEAVAAPVAAPKARRRAAATA